MMNNFVTADLHLGHANIIKYCNRPFDNIDDMNKILIKRWNERVKKEDVVFCLGDFCFKGGVESGLKKSQYWEQQLNGKIIHIKGNHDSNNSTKTIIESMILRFANYNIYCCHIPPEEFIPNISFILCGHVHEKWIHRIEKNIIINVGVDVWNFFPKKLDEIIKYYNKLKNNVIS